MSIKLQTYNNESQYITNRQQQITIYYYLIINIFFVNINNEFGRSANIITNG